MDLPSVVIVSAFVTTLVGLLLLHSGLKAKADALLWWGASNLLLAFGTVAPMVSRTLADGAFIEVANAAVLIGWGVFWAGILRFERRPASLAWAAAGGVVWLVASLFPAFQDDPTLRLVLNLVVSCAYVTASAAVLLKGRSEPLASRNAAIVLLCAHAVILVGRIPEALLSNWLAEHTVSRMQLFAAFATENLLFIVAMAFVLLAMMKERLEAVQKNAAYTDPLTRTPNRRAFFEWGGTILAECRQAGSAAAVILFDLDRFKAINDEHGHGAGDRTLVVFARAALPELRSRDLFARIGGEEFACLLPGLSLGEAVGTAERIRQALERATVEGPQHPFSVTVSAGVQLADPTRVTLDEMMRGADRALYRAKDLGRNRVQVNTPDLARADGERAENPEGRLGSVVRAFRNRA